MMIRHEEFRFQRHLELWKDQNRTIKRMIVLILLFGFLVLFRVLIPFSENTEVAVQDIQAKEKAREEIKAKNLIARQLEDKLREVKLIIRKQPWMAEKESLIRTFVELKNSGRPGRAQTEADKTIRAITNIVRVEIANPLVKVLTENPEIAASMPDLHEKIIELKEFANQWEVDHIGRRWFRTLERKTREMADLTTALEIKTAEVSSTLTKTIQTLNAQIKAGNQEIAVLSNAIDEANEHLKDVLDQLFPKWMKGIINIQQMTQVFPIALLVLLLYLAWTAGSISRHYHYVARHLKFEDEDKSDVTVSTIWTFAEKSMIGMVMTVAVYCFIVLVVWLFFEKGIDILHWWMPLAREDELLWDATIFRGVEWTGRVVFATLIILALFHQRITKASTGLFNS